MPGTALTSEEVLTMLSAAPQQITALMDGLTPAQLRSRPAPDEWSANDVLAHLRACADQWGGSITIIITEDQPTIRAINPRTWINQTDYRELEFRPSLQAFASQRAELIATLEALPPEGWSRSATVTGAGAPLMRTVLSYGAWLARHERPHLKQLARIAEKSRAE